MNTEPTKPPAKILIAQRQVATGEDFKKLKCSLSLDEFHAMRWAAARTLNARGEMLPLNEFMRRALLEQVREVVSGEIAKNRKIPPDIAAVVANRRGEF